MQDGLHTHHLTLGYDVDGENYVLDLRLNRELLPSDYFVKYQHGGKHVINRPTGKDVELCQYLGSIRGVKDSWAALSTCKGLQGVVFDGKNMHYIETGQDGTLESPHYLYKHEDLVVNHTCGYNSGPFNSSDNHLDNNSKYVLGNIHNEFNRILRYKRSEPEAKPHLRGPYNANKQSRYVELVLVVDHKEYKEFGENVANIYHRCKDIANIINALYAPLNIFVALVGVVVWTEMDEILLSENGDTTLTNFLHYRRERLVKEHPNDNAQLLTRQQFTGGVVGKALKGPICTYEFSGGVSMDHSNVVGLVATTIAHEMGHNFGMEHDTEECKCPQDRCIMSPSSSSFTPSHWSTCSLEFLALAFEHGMDYCLRNKPMQLFDSPVCGNGFVEAGEQCDCGLEAVVGSHATSECASCCDTQTCMLRKNATCATGECCDLKLCRPYSAGMICRSADHECDLPEFCTGESEFCPDDIFKMDTEPCDGAMAFCYQGSCRTRSDQCRLLWGPSGESSDDQCYEMNKKGSRNGNCGYNRLKQHFSSCQEENIFCGMLHCRHLNERLEFGMESVAILSHSFINNRGSIIPCRTAIVDLGLNQIDPGLVPDGAKCGVGKMCVNQKCMAVSSLRLATHVNEAAVCPSDCSGHGVCNSLGHCHCDKGFAPPLCELPGPGGSQDSGPASNPNVHRDVMTAMYVIFLGIIPGVLLLAFLSYYSRHNVIIWWKKPAMVNKSSAKHSLQRRFSRGGNCFDTNIRSASNTPSNPSSPVAANGTRVNTINSPDDISSSLLKSDPPPRPQPTFFGHFNGFTLTPISKEPQEFGVLNENFGVENETRTASVNRANGARNVQSPAKGPVRVAPPPPVVKTATVTRSQTRTATEKPTSPIARSNTVAIAPTLPPQNAGANPRPLISSPVLEASTCSAKELMSPLKHSVPLRPAPTAPEKRPLSAANPETKTLNPDDPLPKKPKDGTALNRIASFLKPVERSNSLPRNPNHRVKFVKNLDKGALRTLQISNPILQKDIELPSGVVPVVSDSDDEGKISVNRAQSMRGPGIAPKPNIPAFGSMRNPPGLKRPVSIPTGNRPTSPPPPRPNERTDYDDCVPEKTAPLANISEESSPIYAVIEESLPAKKVVGKPSEYKSPKPTAVGDDGMSLLGEIVTEIQSRNFDSIYSTSTLARKKKEKEAREAALAKEKDAHYMNAGEAEGEYSNASNVSTTSSGYLNPAAVNVPVARIPPNPGVNKPKLSSFKSDAVAFQRSDGKRLSLTSPPSPTKTSSKLPTLTKQITPPNLKVGAVRPVSKSFKNSPDLVSSCVTDRQKIESPDVVARTKSNVNEGVILKPTVNNKTVQKTVAKPPSPKPTLKPAPAPPIDKKKIPPARPSLPKITTTALNAKSNSFDKSIPAKPKTVLQTQKSDPSIKTKPVKFSNVANLQQKFEAKPGGATRTNVTAKK